MFFLSLLLLPLFQSIKPLSKQNVMHNICRERKINFQFMYLNSKTQRRVRYGTRYHQRDVFQRRGRAIVIHFGKKMKRPSMGMDVCVCVCFSFACVRRHDSKNAGWQSGSTDPPSDPTADSPSRCGPGSISNFWELISLQQEGAHCPICPKDIIEEH